MNFLNRSLNNKSQNNEKMKNCKDILQKKFMTDGSFFWYRGNYLVHNYGEQLWGHLT